MNDYGLVLVDYIYGQAQPLLPGALAAAVHRELGRTVRWVHSGAPLERYSGDLSKSGPSSAAQCPLSRGDADLAFMCGPPFGDLLRGPSPKVELLGLAPVFDDPRLEDRPRYVSEIVARSGVYDRLRAGEPVRWAYNDETSWSGYFAAMAYHLRVGGRLAGSTWSRTGSHTNSVQAVMAGAAEIAAIDSFAWRRLGPAASNCGLSVVGFEGPSPIQPVVVRSELDDEAKGALRQALVRVEPIDEIGFVRFGEVALADYRPMFERVESLRAERDQTE